VPLIPLYTVTVHSSHCSQGVDASIDKCTCGGQTKHCQIFQLHSFTAVMNNHTVNTYRYVDINNLQVCRYWHTLRMQLYTDKLCMSPVNGCNSVDDVTSVWQVLPQNITLTVPLRKISNLKISQTHAGISS